MKRLIILLLLFPSLCFAECELARMSPMMMGGYTPVSGCNASTDYVGNQDDSGSTPASNAGVMICNPAVSPSCYGDINTAYIIKANASESSFFLCIYEDDGDETPDSGDSTYACTADNVTSSTGTVSGGALTGYGTLTTLTSGKKYFVCHLTDDDSANALAVDTKGDSITQYYKTGLTAPPANLNAFSSAAGTTKAVWVTIGD